MSEATVCLLEGKGKIGRNSVNPRIPQIKERDSIVLKGR